MAAHQSSSAFYIILAMVALFLAIAAALLSPAGILIEGGWSEGNLLLKIISILGVIGAIYFFYRAYLQAAWDNYRKQIPYEPVSPPKDYLAIFLKKALRWLINL